LSIADDLLVVAQ